MKPDQERVKTLLADTVTLLCRNGLHFQRQLRVQGVLGITVDDTDVFIVHINESFTDQGRGARLADFQGPLGSGFTAQLVATLSGQQAVSTVTPQGGNTMLPKWPAQTKQKMAEGVEVCPSTGTIAMKRPKLDLQYPNLGLDGKDLGKEIATVQQVTVALPGNTAVASQWQFDSVPKMQQQNQRTAVSSDATCYLAYTTGSGNTTNSVLPTNKRKANVYPPPQAMLAMSFGGLASTVDYGNSILQATTLQPTGCPSNSVHSTSENKLWNEQILAQQQQSLASEEQRLNAGATVFDPLAGCATWTVQHLVDGHDMQTLKQDDQHQQQSSLDVVSRLLVQLCLCECLVLVFTEYVSDDVCLCDSPVIFFLFFD